jgi:hypothetical protein
VAESPEILAAKGEQIYEKVRKDYEATHPGQYVAIDVTTGKLYPAPNSEDALEAARADSPNGIFHLVRVGARGAFKVSSMMRSADGGWLIRV